MSRTGLFSRLQRLLAAAHVARRTGRRPAQILTEAARRRGPSRRAVIAGGAATAAILPWASACGDDLTADAIPVAVIGGGIAGLHCAYRLVEAGVDAVVFEASARTGGRMFTARDRFRDDQTCELGGELIDTGHETIRGLAADLGLALDDLAAVTAGLRADTFHFDGVVVEDQAIVVEFTPVAAQMAAAVIAAEADDDEFERIDAMSIPAWLATEAGLAADSLVRRILELAYTGEYGLEPDEQSIFNVLYLIDHETPDPFRIFGDSDERFHVHGGSDQIPAALAAALGEARVRVEHTLTRVAARRDGRYDLAMAGPAGRVELVADHVVLALPFSRLRQVDLGDAGLPDDKREMIDELGYGTNAKLMIGFASRPWADPGGASGSSFTDVGALQSTWDSSRGQAGASGILTNYVGGDRGVAIGAGEPAARASEALPWIDQVFPGAAAAATGDAVRMHWPTHPHTLGSYACYRPGQWAFWSREGERVGNLHFCGEHTSLDFQGYMEGGAETGGLVALEILDDLGVPPTARLSAIAAAKLALPQATYHAGRFRGERRRWRRNQRRRIL
jgi:monoamine oxidase